VLVADFYTPNFFDPIRADGVRYSFTGEINGPRKVLDGGYLSWLDPESRHLWQLFVGGDDPGFKDRGEIPRDMENLRAVSDRHSEPHRKRAITGRIRGGLMTTGRIGAIVDPGNPFAARLDSAHKAHAEMVEEAIRPFVDPGQT
jgi:hypothetical protein